MTYGKRSNKYKPLCETTAASKESSARVFYKNPNRIKIKTQDFYKNKCYIFLQKYTNIETSLFIAANCNILLCVKTPFSCSGS